MGSSRLVCRDLAVRIGPDGESGQVFGNPAIWRFEIVLINRLIHKLGPDVPIVLPQVIAVPNVPDFSNGTAKPGSCIRRGQLAAHRATALTLQSVDTKRVVP